MTPSVRWVFDVSQRELDEYLADAKPGDEIFGAFGWKGILVSIDREQKKVTADMEPNE